MAIRELLECRADPRRIAVIFNPVSGTGDPKVREERLRTFTRDAGLTCDLAETDREEGAVPLARRALADGMERVLVSGGDGSVTEAAGVLAGTETALAVLPGGTGNLLAINLNIPTDPEAAVRLALTGEPRPIDIGRANGQVFLILAGMGADARMIQDADRDLKRRLGFLAYFMTAWRNLGKPRVRYTITIDGKTLRRHAQTVLIANLGRIQGGFEFVPGTDPDDGLLEVAILRTRHFRDLVTLVLRKLMGLHHTTDLMEVHRGRHIVVQTYRPQPVQLDGNEAGSTRRLEVKVEPGALRFIRNELPDNPLVAALVNPALLPDWAPFAAGVTTAAVLLTVATTARKKGQEPPRIAQHPFTAGLGAGLGVYFFGQALRRIQRHTAQKRPPGEETKSG